MEMRSTLFGSLRALELAGIRSFCCLTHVMASNGDHSPPWELAGPISVSPGGNMWFTLNARLSCPVCAAPTYAVTVSLNKQGSLFGYCHWTADEAPAACARRFVRNADGSQTSADYALH